MPKFLWPLNRESRPGPAPNAIKLRIPRRATPVGKLSTIKNPADLNGPPGLRSVDPSRDQ